MAGQRRPGSWGLENDPLVIDDGTSCRAPTPPPGPVRDDCWSGSSPYTSSLAYASVGGTASGFDITQAVADFLRSDSWTSLHPLVVSLIGPQTFGLGVIYGMGENVVGGIVGLAQLAKTFLLADLYDRANQPALMAISGPLGPFQNLLADISMRTFREALEEAHTERDQLIGELRYAISNPLEVLGDIGAGYVETWRRFEQLSTQQTLSARFEAGRILGEVLMDVLMVIGTGAAVAKASSKIPRLAKLARLRLSRTGAAGDAAAAVREPPVTPSQARPSAPVAEGVPKKPAVPVSELGPDGVPIAARRGRAPEGLPRQTLTKEGWPDLPAREAANFTSVDPVTLPPGTKLYRVIDDPARASGGYWSETLSASRAEWRGDYAVLKDWNGNGQYVEYMVPEGPGLNVWRGAAAAQQYDGMPFYLPGGGQQIWMKPGTITPSAPKPTGW